MIFRIPFFTRRYTLDVWARDTYQGEQCLSSFDGTRTECLAIARFILANRLYKQDMVTMTLSREKSKNCETLWVKAGYKSMTVPRGTLGTLQYLA